MSEPEKPVDPERRSALRANDAALASSSPDQNSLLMQMLRMQLDQNSGLGRIAAFLINLIWVVCVFGVPALLALQVFVDKNMQAESARREFELNLTKAKTLDAGGEILTSIKAIGGKLDAQGGQITAQGVKLTQLAEDVQDLRAAQAATDKRVAGVATKQGQLEKRMSQPAE